MIFRKDAQGVFEKLPQKINDQINREIFEHDIIKFSFLRNVFSEKTIYLLIDIIEEIYFMPSDIIIQPDDPNENSLYLIKTGKV
jgi:hypothetical protein